MKKLFDTFNQLDEAADSVSEASKVLAESWRTILISTGLITFVGSAFMVLYSFWRGRDAMAELVYKTLTAGSSSAPTLTTPWSRLPVEEFPEFWVCGSGGCQIDQEKRKAVLEILYTLKGESGAIRAVFSMYGLTYRRVAAQSVSLGNKTLEEELWLIPISQDGYDDNVVRHRRGQCNEITISELEEGSILRVEAPLYNTAFLKNCPVDRGDVPYSVEGYITLDFELVPGETDKDGITILLREAVEKVEAIMGYDV